MDLRTIAALSVQTDCFTVAAALRAGRVSERIRAIFARLINACWFLFKVVLLLGLLAAFAGIWYFYGTLNDELRKQVQRKIAEGYPHLDVHVHEVIRVEGEGIVIRGLTLTERDAGGPQAELAHFEEILLSCRAQLQDLISGNLDVTHVVLRRPTLRATRRTDGSWSVQKLLPLPEFGGTARSMAVEQGNMTVFDPLKNPSGILKIRDINLQLEFSSIRADDPTDKSVTRFKGSLTGDRLGRAEVEGSVNKASGVWKLAGQLDGISLSPQLQQALPGDVSGQLTAIQPLRGRLAMTFHANHDPRRPRPFQIKARGRLEGGRIDDDRLPYPLTDVNGTVRIDQDGVVINDMTARSGRTTFRMHGQQIGFGRGRKIALEGKAERLDLDRQMVTRLPDTWKENWYRYQPSGEVNATFRMTHDGQRWRPELTVNCVSVAFTHYKFPYRLERGNGSITLKGNHLSVDLTAFAGSRPVKLTAEVTNPGRYGVGQLVASTTELPVDQRFIAAVPENVRRVIQSFDPRGSINAYVQVTRETPDQPWRPHYIVDLNKIAIRYDKFPYPVHNLRGRLEGLDQHWTYRNLTGGNGTGALTAEGQSVPTPTGSKLSLRIFGNDVAMDKELEVALPPTMQGLWKRMNPKGRVNIGAELTFDSATNQLDLKVQTDMVANGISVEPDFFPYRMENLRGSVNFQNGRADFANLTASHGQTRMTVTGNCRFPADGSWNCHFTRLSVDRIRADRELLFALPSGLRSGLTTLNFTGPLNLTGAIRFARASAIDAPVTSDWNFNINTLQGRIDCGIELDQINGGVNLVGGCDGQQFYSRGRLDIDSLLYEGFQFTQVQGPLWLNSEQVLFGAWADPPKTSGQLPQRVTARFYGGSIVGDCRIALQRRTSFVLNAQLADGDLARFAAEQIPGGRNLRGKVTGNLQLQGTSRRETTLAGQLNGRGALRMRDGDVYELPIVLSLLKLLSVRQPDSTAFNTCDINFHIDGAHILFDEFNVHGDAISMLGKGEMDFDKNLRMVFHAIIGNDQLRLPIVRPVLKMASKQLLLLYVYGTLDDPKTTREALPGVRRAVQEIQGEPDAGRSILGQTTDWLQDLIPGQ